MSNTKIRQLKPRGKKKSKKTSSTRSSKKSSSRRTSGEHSSKSPNHKPDGGFAKGNTASKDHWWKPGQSGNPAGRPKGLDMTTAFRKVLEKPAKDVPSAVDKAASLGMDIEDPSVRVVDVLMEATVTHIMMGKGDILKQGWERIEGSVKQSIGMNEDDPVYEYLEFMREMTEPEASTSPARKSRGGNGKPKKVRKVKVRGNGKP